MADHAPGYEQAAEDLQCYNCGIKGHMFLACPEDARRVPAGLEASRKRQASSNDYSAPIKRNKGPVVTHYPPPPPPGLPHISPPPPPTAYSPRPVYEGFHTGPPPGPPPGPPYHQPPHPGHYDHYPPSSTGRSASEGFPYGNPRDIYEHHFQAPPRVPPPETSYRPPYYDQYDQRHSGLSPSAHYGRPYSAPPDRYDEHPAGPTQGSPYITTHRSHQAHFEHYPPAPGVDSYHPRPPQPYPPPHSSVYRSSSQYGYDVAPPVRSYTPGHGSPPPGPGSYQSHHYPPPDPTPYHARYDDRLPDRPSYEPQRRNHRTQHIEPHSGDNRQNYERHGRRTRYDSPKHRSRSERRFADRPNRLPSPINSTTPARPVKSSNIPDGSKPRQEFDNTVPKNTATIEEYTAEEFKWDEEMIFKELPIKVTKDLIRDPLPIEWTDDPIMPPKYDKETITSKYINPTNVDDFALSVRETKAWQIMQYHPAFLPATDVRIEKLSDYEKALTPGLANSKQNRHSASSNRQRGKLWGPKVRRERQTQHSQQYRHSHPSNDDQFNHVRPAPRKRSWDQASFQGAEELGREADIIGKEPKISSPEPGEVCETDDQEPLSTTKSIIPSWEQENHHIRRSRRDPTTSVLQHTPIDPPGVISEGNAHQPSLQAASTPLPPDRLSGSPSRPLSRGSSQASPSRPSSKHSSKSNPSRPSSRGSSIASPLTPNERELLGMRPYSSGSDTGRDSPTPQENGASTRSRQRPAKLHAAYQRRW